jgi:hypothetical protein
LGLEKEQEVGCIKTSSYTFNEVTDGWRVRESSVGERGV